MRFWLFVAVLLLAAFAAIKSFGESHRQFTEMQGGVQQRAN